MRSNSFTIAREFLVSFVKKTAKEKTDVSFVVIHNEAVLGESSPVAIDSSFNEPPKIFNVNFATKLTFTIGDRGSVDSLVSTPVLSKTLFLYDDVFIIHVNLEMEELLLESKVF